MCIIPHPVLKSLPSYYYYLIHHRPLPTYLCNYRALTCLSWLDLVDDMLGITRNSLFPTAEEVASLSLHFSLPAPLETILTPMKKEESLDSELSLQRPRTPYVASRRTKRRVVWTPLDNTNPEFDQSIRKRAGLELKDYIQSNMVSGNVFYCCWWNCETILVVFV